MHSDRWSFDRYIPEVSASDLQRKWSQPPESGSQRGSSCTPPPGLYKVIFLLILMTKQTYFSMFPEKKVGHTCPYDVINMAAGLRAHTFQFSHLLTTENYFWDNFLLYIVFKTLMVTYHVLDFILNQNCGYWRGKRNAFPLLFFIIFIRFCVQEHFTWLALNISKYLFI